MARPDPSFRPETLATLAGRDPAAQYGAVNPPVVHASTVLFATLDALDAAPGQPHGAMVYGRHGTPTSFAFESAVAALEGGGRAIALPSGAAAISAVLCAFTRAGDHILLADAVYGPTRRFATEFLPRYGVAATFYPPDIGAGIAQLMRPETRLVFLESPGSLTFEMQDVPAIAAAAHAAGAVACLDNTWATPLFFRGFDHGVDIIIHAATKYLVGHADAMMGVIVAAPPHFPMIKRAVVDLGYAVGPDDCYLALRGLRTLPVRLARHQESGIAIARWLAARPEVTRVIHPALDSHPGHALWRRDFTGATGLFAFELAAAPRAALAALVDHMALFGMGYSWGGFESLLLPCDPARLRTAVPWTGAGQLMRVHIGLEDPADLIADLEAGLARFNAARGA